MLAAVRKVNQQRQTGGQGTTTDQTGGPGTTADQTGGGRGPPRSPPGPHVIHFTPWKEVAEIEAGRLEFFKQTLTIALAGIGGLAAILVDVNKIPNDWPSKGLLMAFGISAVLLVIASSDGISTYANYLRAVQKASLNPTDGGLRTEQQGSEQSILTHARWAIVLSWIAALILIAFAFWRVVQPSAGAEAAMEKAREIVSIQPGNPTLRSLEHFRTVGDDYLITYITDPNQARYTVKVNSHTNSVLEVAPEPNP
jgi:hypothetical protein